MIDIGKNSRLGYVLNMSIAFLLLLTVAVNRSGKIMGIDISNLHNDNTSKTEMPAETVIDDQTRIIHSAAIVKNIAGYGGVVPLDLRIREKRIAGIELGKNSESPEFIESVIQTGLLEKWNGLTMEEALQLQVDAVSGATLSSAAIIETVRQTTAYALNNDTPDTHVSIWNMRSIAGIIVLLLGTVLFLKKNNSPRMRTMQLILNVAVLGIWCGSFLSLNLLVNWLSNGIHLSTALVPFMMLVLTVILPFAGKKGSYCNWHCPMGSAQELAGKVIKKKISIPPAIVSKLNMLREAILLLLLFLMWIGVAFELMNYEIFSVFLFRQASVIVMVSATVFMALSLFVNRPYCRFVCPTGALLKFTQR